MSRLKQFLDTRHVLAAACAVAGFTVAGIGINVADAVAAPKGDPEAGADVYEAECRGCHDVSIAPTLRGVINRKIAGDTAFMGYSDALKSKNAMTWTEATLDTFIATPQDFAPGSHMTKSIADAQMRADVIAFIATLPPPR